MSASPQTIAQAAPQNHVLNLLTFGKLHSHLADVEEEAQSLFLQLVKQYAEQEGLTEHLKATNQMEWVQRMKNIQERVKEIIDKNLMFLRDIKWHKKYPVPFLCYKCKIIGLGYWGM